MAKRNHGDHRIERESVEHADAAVRLPELGCQPFNRDCAFRAFDRRSKAGQDGQSLAGTGALVFEGEVLSLPVKPFGLWH